MINIPLPVLGEFIIKRTLSRNWGLFEGVQVKAPGYWRLPKCPCEFCPGHKTWQVDEFVDWRVIIVDVNLDIVTNWAARHNFTAVVIDDPRISGGPFLEK